MISSWGDTCLFKWIMNWIPFSCRYYFQHIQLARLDVFQHISTQYMCVSTRTTNRANRSEMFRLYRTQYKSTPGSETFAYPHCCRYSCYQHPGPLLFYPHTLTPSLLPIRCCYCYVALFFPFAIS